MLGSHCPVLVADYLIAKSRGRLTPLQVIKLVYIAHGYSLALLGKPLAGETIEAWRYGPVVPSVYHSAKKHGGSPIGDLLYSGISVDDRDGMADAEKFFAARMPQEQREILDGGLEGYGDFTGPELIDMTHKEDPWKRHYKPRVMRQKIPDEAIKEYYSGVIANGRP